MTCLRKHFLLACLSLIGVRLLGQTIVYQENFTVETGKGVTGPSPYTYDTSGVNWSIDVSSCSLTATSDYFQVNANEQLEGSDLDGVAIWFSRSIDISGFDSVDCQVKLYETGNLSSTEYIRVYYIVDQGLEILFANNGDMTDDFTQEIATHKYISGSSLQLVIRMKNSYGTRSHSFDDISVTESVTNPPSVGSVLFTEYARFSISNRGYVELFNTTDTAIDLLGSKIISSGSNNKVIDLGTDIIGTTVVPANGFLILNRDASLNNFESSWGVDLSNMDDEVQYIRTGENSFGNNNLFQLKYGGSPDTDDGLLIDQTNENAAVGQRVFQLPLGYWTGNLDSSEVNATPGFISSEESFEEVDLVFSSGAWHAASGVSFANPSSNTSAINAVVYNGEATFNTGDSLQNLSVIAGAGVLLSNEHVAVKNEIYVKNEGSITITGTGSLTCDGKIVLEKQGYAQSTDYNIWGSPFSSLLDMDAVFSQQNNCDFYVWEASTQTWKYDEVIGGFLNCAGTLYPVTSNLVLNAPEGTADGNFDIGRGYFIVGNLQATYEFIDSTSAGLNNGDISVNLYGSSEAFISGSNDWNLICNPYPSALSVSDFLTENSGSIINAVYLYNPGNGLDTAASYDTYNSTHTSISIASCQGFYVDANTTTDGLVGTLDFKNDMRNNTNDNFRSMLSYFGVYLKITDSKGISDETRIYFDEDAQEGFDRTFDALKLENAGFNFCSKVGSRKLVFNGYAPLTTDKKMIPLYFQTNHSSVYTLVLDDLVGSFNNKDIYLEDRFNRVSHDLKLGGYVFYSDSHIWDNRFYIHIIHKKEGGNNSTSNNLDSVTTHMDEVKNFDEVISVYLNENQLIVTSLLDDVNITSIEIWEIKGQLIMSRNPNTGHEIIDLGAMAHGIYVVKTVLGKDNIQVRKFIYR